MDKSNAKIKNVLSIAGVDPSGGAGVLADVKAMSACGAYAMGVVAALTAQNTQAVTGVMPVSAEFVTKQIDTIFEDIRVDAVKIGMLGSVEVMKAVREALLRWKPKKVVLDTVMVAKSGDRLMPDDAVMYFREALLPLADMITPNLPEAEVLLSREISDMNQMDKAAEDLRKLCGGNTIVYLKGGHLHDQESSDLVLMPEARVVLSSPRYATKNTHGTGCSLSSALAAYWAQYDDEMTVVRKAKDFISQAIASSDELDVGHGHGPVHHFVDLYKNRKVN